MTTCSKTGYLKRSQAKLAARRFSTQGLGKVHAYLCGDCGRYHIGHRERQRVIPCRWCGQPITLAPWNPGGPDMPTDPETLRPHNHPASERNRTA